MKKLIILKINEGCTSKESFYTFYRTYTLYVVLQIEEKDRHRVFRHWARPTRLQYNILYDYQHNYYDGYIAYMDRRQRGLYDPVPLPETWEERVLRTCTKDGRRLSSKDFPLVKSKLNDYMVIPSICRADHDKHYYYRQYYDQLIGTPWSVSV